VISKKELKTIVIIVHDRGEGWNDDG